MKIFILSPPHGWNKGIINEFISPTVNCGVKNWHLLVLEEKNGQFKLRMLTPSESWKLMGFSNNDFSKVKDVNSNSQLYKQAGNSIVKNVLVAILGQMIPGKENIYKEME
jgi:DNA (cytosine-5)-methyltransferase 1